MNKTIHCSCGVVFSTTQDAGAHIYEHRRAPDAHQVVDDTNDPAAAASAIAHSVDLAAQVGAASMAEDPKARQAIPLVAVDPFAAQLAALADRDRTTERSKRIEAIAREVVDAKIEMMHAWADREHHIAVAEAMKSRYEAARGKLETLDHELDTLLRELLHDKREAEATKAKAEASPS